MPSEASLIFSLLKPNYISGRYITFITLLISINFNSLSCKYYVNFVSGNPYLLHYVLKNTTMANRRYFPIKYFVILYP